MKFPSLRKMFAKKEKKIEHEKTINLRDLSLITTFIGLLLVYANLQFLAKDPQIFSIINLMAAVITLGIPLMYRYSNYSKMKKVESLFPKFLSDITSNIRSGMTLPQAIRSTTQNDYGVLTPYVHEMHAKISWGIPFDIVLNEFAQRIGSDSLKRTVQNIIETHRSGGTIDTAL